MSELLEAAVLVVCGVGALVAWYQHHRPDDTVRFEQREGVVPVKCGCGFTGPVDVWWSRPNGYWAKCPDCGSTEWVEDPYPGQ